MVEDKDENVGSLVKASLRMWGKSSPRRFLFFVHVVWRMWRGERRRVRQSRILGSSVCRIIALSPTMACNYYCIGCYSRGRPDEDEFSTEELETLFGEAEFYGVLAMIITGGEPLLRDDILPLMKRHRKILFVFITNGSLMTPEIARRLAESGNVVTLVSMEGFYRHTEKRRGDGTHETALQAIRLLKASRACYGFAATVTKDNSSHIITEDFIDTMTGLGCAVGYFVEYIPCGENPSYDLLMNGEQREMFRRHVLELRRGKPIVLIHFPDDEYGKDGRCSAAGKTSIHINSQGGVEPCPFVDIAVDNVRRGGLVSAFRSSFLQKIRERPELLTRNGYACALFDHRVQVEDIAGQCQPRTADRE